MTTVVSLNSSFWFVKILACTATGLLLCASSAFAFDEKKYNGLLESARQHSQAMEVEAAIKDLTAAIKLNPSDPRTFQLRAEGFRDLNLLPEALKDINHAIELSPKDAGLWRDKGWLHYKNGQHKLAVEDYSKALELNPKDGNAYRSRARSYWCLKDWKSAAADYEKCLQFKSKAILRTEVENRASLGDLYLKDKRFNEALAQFNYLIEHYPQISKGYYGRADLYKQQGKTDLAKRDLQKAHELDYEMDPALRKL